MDEDRTIQKCKQYSAEYWATVKMTIRAKDMTLAVERFNSLFTEEGGNYLDGDSYQDIQAIGRRSWDSIHHERRYEFRVFLSVCLGFENRADDLVEEEARDMLEEALDKEHPDWLTDVEIIGMELEDVESLGESYRD